jgi:ATP-dependent DNA helicase RecQ
MALTATATAETRKEVVRILGMSKPEYVVRSPDKPNIIYCVEKKTAGIDEVFNPLVEELRQKRTKMTKTLVFCRRQNDCSELYMYFKSKHDVHKFRLFDMFTACNSPSLKSSIIKSFVSDSSRLRIVFATVAFGMGVNVPGIRQIFHWCPPSNIEAYIQETGRAGRDGEVAIVKLFYSKADLSPAFVEDSIKSYCTKTQKPVEGMFSLRILV